MERGQLVHSSVVGRGGARYYIHVHVDDCRAAVQLEADQPWQAASEQKDLILAAVGAGAGRRAREAGEDHR